MSTRFEFGFKYAYILKVVSLWNRVKWGKFLWRENVKLTLFFVALVDFMWYLSFPYTSIRWYSVIAQNNQEILLKMPFATTKDLRIQIIFDSLWAFWIGRLQSSGFLSIVNISKDGRSFLFLSVLWQIY